MSDSLTSASKSIILRLKIQNEPGLFARAVTAIGEAGANVGAIDIVRYEQGFVVRDITVDTTGSDSVAQQSKPCFAATTDGIPKPAPNSRKV